MVYGKVCNQEWTLETCDRLDYVLKYRHRFRSMFHSEHNWLEGLCDHENRERQCFICPLTTFASQLLYLKFAMEFLACRNCELDDKIPDLIQRPNLFLELILPTLGPLNLDLIVRLLADSLNFRSLFIRFRGLGDLQALRSLTM